MRIHEKEGLIKIGLHLFCVIVFIFIFVWFGMIHPLIIYDGDDWTYISYTRDAIPSQGRWNPSRIFPETFMSMPATFAAYVIYPITKDYIGAIAWTYAFIAAVFITTYCYTFVEMIIHKFHLNCVSASLCGIIFLILHYSILKNSDTDNVYLFWSQNTTCFFFYTLSNILNAILLMFFLNNELNDFFSKKNKTNLIIKGAVLLGIYLVSPT